VVLVILDGWGIGRDEPGNAVLAAATPVMDGLLANYPNATLRTSGEDVGLPAGQMGNSEVGHLNLGAGFIVYQWITRIDRAIATGEFFANPVLVEAIDHIKATGGRLHLLGLVSDGGVHSHERHLVALLELCRRRSLERVAVHAFTDGRDTPPTSGLGHVAELERAIAEIGLGEIATVSGRYYAMDRDRRWERTRLAYDAIVKGTGIPAVTGTAAVSSAYESGLTDEFIVPAVIDGYGGVEPGDGMVFFNFRADRGRQLSQALCEADFAGFERSRDLSAIVPLTTMTRYEEGLRAAVAFEPHDVSLPLAKVISDAGLLQFHCAETEKYAHVTFFFNGGREEPFAGETRRLLPSPKVATYDLQPEMSAHAVTDAVVDALDTGNYGFVIVNFANCDMVGHTGSLSAAIAAVETVDGCLGRVVDATLAAGGVALVTADHGNAEEMIDRDTGGPMTAHTTNPVPVVLVTGPGSPFRDVMLRDGVLSAVAPTVLRLLGIPVPSAMTTPSLFG
jgi:2,3-bisphosphoglycerate-independent phosphoglycerate mutase